MPCGLGDPEPLRQAFAALMEGMGERVARYGPRQPYTIEKKGLLGRAKAVEIPVGAEAVWYADEHGSGQFSVNLFHPDGWPGAAGRPIPVGASPSVSDATYYSFDLDLSSSPARAAADVAGVCVAVFGTAMGSDWQVTVDDLA